MSGPADQDPRSGGPGGSRGWGERGERGEPVDQGPPFGPPWAWRADRGRYGPWNRNDPRYREMRLRARLYRRAQARSQPWHRRQGFGCIFAILFLLVVGSIVTATATVLSQLGPVPVIIAVFAVVTIAASLLRGMAGAARDLDAMLSATRRVQEGDYSVRLGSTRSDLAPIQELARGFDTMAARLEADEEQRRSLLADVSHELRTPLTVITGNLEAIVDGVHPPDPAHLSSILDETRVMERLIEDLRTVTLSEAGTLALHREPTDPDVLIGEVLHAFEPGATAAGVTLESSSTEDLPILDIDPVRIREVLSNLVANALRHTPTGGRVTVGGMLTPASVVLTVRDTGPGIDAALLPHVFDRFVKGAGSRGSGLGLAIARGLVEAHGGTIAVQSPAGGGTTFRVELPRGAEG